MEWIVVAIVGYAVFKYATKRGKRVERDVIAEGATQSLEQCSETIRVSLLTLARMTGEMSDDFMPLSFDLMKYASAIRMRPDHIPTICVCIVASFHSLGAVTNSAVYRGDERKRISELEKRLEGIAVPASEYLLGLLGRRVTDAEQEEVGRFLDGMSWDKEANRFVSA